MPQHKDLKRLVRARVAETSENYTQALTALLSQAKLDPLPDGWFMAGSHPADYDAGLLPQSCAYDGSRVIRLRFRSADPPGGFGTVMQSIDAAQYRGCRVRFSAVIRGREVTDWAGTWLRIDTAHGARRTGDRQHAGPAASRDRRLDGGRQRARHRRGSRFRALRRPAGRGGGGGPRPGPGSRSSAPTCPSPSSWAGRWRPGPRASTSAPPDTGHGDAARTGWHERMAA